MAKRRQIVIMSSEPQTPSGLAPMGSVRRITEQFSRFNTAPDGSPALTTVRLFGPGMVVELPQGFDQVTQAMVTVNEEDIAWPVLSRVCREFKWKMVDLDTGRSFGGT